MPLKRGMRGQPSKLETTASLSMPVIKNKIIPYIHEFTEQAVITYKKLDPPVKPWDDKELLDFLHIT